ncbi:DUF6518 family protein [Glycomyces tarimensis]
MRTADERVRVLPLLAVSIAAGLALGAVDLIAQRELPYPWANLANSSAVWAIGAFAIGSWVRHGRWRPILAGIVLLTVAVEAYYLAAVLIQNDSPATMWQPTTFAWLVFAIVAGAVFGTAGAWARSNLRWRNVLGVAALGAVFLAESAMLLQRVPGAEGDHRADSIATAVIMAVIGLAVPVLLGRGPLGRLLSLALSLPLAAIAFAGFLLAGFGS